MAITNRYLFKTIVQTSDGDVFEVVIDQTGTGVVRKMIAVGDNLGSHNQKSYALSETAITVDGGSLTSWLAMSKNQKVHAAVYNTTKSLNTVCAAL